MQIATGKIVAGKIIVDGLSFREGETVTVLARDVPNAVYLTPEEEAELQEVIAEAERGETLSLDQLRARLEGEH